MDLKGRTDFGIGLPQSWGDVSLFPKLEPILFRFRFYVRNVFAKSGFEFAADDVGGEAGAKEAAVEGGQLALVDFAAIRAQLTLDALSDDASLVGVLGGFFEEIGRASCRERV